MHSTRHLQHLPFILRIKSPLAFVGESQLAMPESKHPISWVVAYHAQKLSSLIELELMSVPGPDSKFEIEIEFELELISVAVPKLEFE